MSTAISIPMEIVTDKRLRDSDKLLYGVVCSESGTPSMNKLAGRLGVSTSQVSKAVSRLRACGYLQGVLSGRRWSSLSTNVPVISTYVPITSTNVPVMRTNVLSTPEPSRDRITVAFKDLSKRDPITSLRVDTDKQEDRGNRESLRGEEGEGTETSASSTPGVASPSPPGCAPPPSPSPKPKVLKDAPSTPEFEEFWSQYPRKIGKAEARKVWAKLSPDAELVSKIMQGLAYYKRKEWKGKEKIYVPHPTTWLNQRRWEDGADGNWSSTPDSASKYDWPDGPKGFEIWKQQHGNDTEPYEYSEIPF